MREAKYYKIKAIDNILRPAVRLLGLDEPQGLSVEADPHR